MPYLLVTVLFLIVPPLLWAAAPAVPPAEASDSSADLAWFIAGLRDLGQSRKTSLKLLPAQAKKILPELEALVKEKILLTEVPARTRREPGGSGVPGPGGAMGPGPSGGAGQREERRQQMVERNQKTAARIQKAIDRMDGVLRRAQSDYIMNMSFDPASYGLSSRFRRSSMSGEINQAEIQKMMQAQQKGLERLVKLNQEVLAMVRKLAKTAK